MTNGEGVSEVMREIPQQKKVFGEVRSYVEQRLGPRKPWETDVLAFFIDRKWTEGMQAADVLTSLGVHAEDEPPIVSLAIRNAISDEYERELGDQIEVATDAGDMGRVGVLQAFRQSVIKDEIQAEASSRAGHIVSLGFVPPDFLPTWLKK